MATPPQGTALPDARPIALIAVHGVGTAGRGDTARSLSLLLAPFASRAGFEEHAVHIPLRDPRPTNTRTPESTIRAEAQVAWSTGSHLGDAITRAHCALYDGDVERAYSTACFTGEVGQRPTHLFELRWSDIVTGNAPSLAVFLRRILRLPAHALRMARRAAEYGGLDGFAPWLWPAHRALLGALTVLLAIAVPALNFVAIASDAVLPLSKLPTSVQRAIAVTLASLLTFAGTAMTAFLLRAARWSSALFLPLFGTLVAAAWALHEAGTDASRCAALAVDGCMCAALLVGAVVVGSLERSGAIRVVLGCALLATGIGLARPPHRGAEAVGQLAWGLLSLTWVLIDLCACLLLFSCVVLCLRAGLSSRRRGTRRSALTSTCACAAVALAAHLLQGVVVRWAGRAPWGASQEPSLVLYKEILDSCTYSIPLTAACALIVVTTVFIYALSPSVLAEISAPLDPGTSTVLGGWLTRGLSLLRGTLIAGLVVVIPASLVLLSISYSGNATEQFLLSDRLWYGLSTFALAAAIGVARSRAALSSIWPLFAILFDIEAYLDESPARQTARARMTLRLQGLLDWVLQGGLNGQSYARVIIVSHSQGTVLVTDTLRVMAEGGPPVELITMGSPLRAIYSLAFPQVYAWVDCGGDGPDPAALRVTRWTNIYRSGDYVGRELWSFDDPRRYDNDYSRRDPRGFWRERCLGPGAHMGYWGDGAVQQLLVDAIAEGA